METPSVITPSLEALFWHRLNHHVDTAAANSLAAYQHVSQSDYYPDLLLSAGVAGVRVTLEDSDRDTGDDEEKTDGEEEVNGDDDEDNTRTHQGSSPHRHSVTPLTPLRTPATSPRDIRAGITRANPAISGSVWGHQGPSAGMTTASTGASSAEGVLATTAHAPPPCDEIIVSHASSPIKRSTRLRRGAHLSAIKEDEESDDDDEEHAGKEYALIARPTTSHIDRFKMDKYKQKKYDSEQLLRQEGFLDSPASMTIKGALCVCA